MAAMNDPRGNHPAEVRADVWLWAARFFRTRSLAKQAIDGGKVDVNGAGCKPARPLHAGDVLRIGRGEERLEVEVLALSERRGPAAAVLTLFRTAAASGATGDTTGSTTPYGERPFSLSEAGVLERVARHTGLALGS